MEFRIADTFTASLARLTAGEQKAAKTTVFDLRVNPPGPSGYESRQWYGLLQGCQPLARRLGGAAHRVLDD